MAAGMAANKPTAVVIRASEMPGPTALRLVEPIWERSWKARMMPITVPISPINGVTEADRKSTRLNSSHLVISYALFCLEKHTIFFYIHESQPCLLDAHASLLS